MNNKFDILVQECNKVIESVKRKNKEIIEIYKDYTMSNTVLTEWIDLLKTEISEKEEIYNELENLKDNIAIFLPHNKMFLNNATIKNRLQKNSIDLLTKNDAKFDPINGYDAMTTDEKYWLYDIENLIELFGRKTSFELREDQVIHLTILKNLYYS